MRRLYGQFLNWLHERGDLNPQEGPAERVTHERFVCFLAERRMSVSSNTLFNNLRMLAGPARPSTVSTISRATSAPGRCGPSYR